MDCFFLDLIFPAQVGWGQFCQDEFCKNTWWDSFLKNTITLPLFFLLTTILIKLQLKINVTVTKLTMSYHLCTRNHKVENHYKTCYIGLMLYWFPESLFSFEKQNLPWWLTEKTVFTDIWTKTNLSTQRLTIVWNYYHSQAERTRKEIKLSNPWKLDSWKDYVM